MHLCVGTQELQERYRLISAPKIGKVHLCVGTQELQERYRLSSAPKIGKRCPAGTEKVSCPEGKQKPRKQRNKIWENRAVTPLRKTETDSERDLVFSTHASERTWDNCVSGVELDKITGCLAYWQHWVNSMHACSAQVFLSLSSAFPVWA